MSPLADVDLYREQGYVLPSAWLLRSAGEARSEPHVTARTDQPYLVVRRYARR